MFISERGLPPADFGVDLAVFTQTSQVNLRAELVAALSRATNSALDVGRTLETSVAPEIPESAGCDCARIHSAVDDLVSASIRLASTGPIGLTAMIEWLANGAAMLRLRATLETRLVAESWVPLLVSVRGPQDT
jgi:hypothetical protein